MEVRIATTAMAIISSISVKPFTRRMKSPFALTNDPRKRFAARQKASTGGANREPNGARGAECGELGHDARACEAADRYFTLARSAKKSRVTKCCRGFLARLATRPPELLQRVLARISTRRCPDRP